MDQPAIVFYDGTCGFCDWSVQWLLARDRDGRFHYAPLQGETASANGLSPVGRDPSSVVVVLQDPDGTRRLEQSDAVLTILSRLPSPWRNLAWVVRLVPRFLRDAAYRLFAKHRYKVWGRVESCRIPSGTEREKFLP